MSLVSFQRFSKNTHFYFYALFIRNIVGKNLPIFNDRLEDFFKINEKIRCLIFFENDDDPKFTGIVPSSDTFKVQ